MRAAARGEVVVGDVHEAQHPGASGLLAQRQRRRLLGGDEPHAHLAVLPHHTVGVVFGGGDLLRRHRTAEVDGGARAAEMEAFSARPADRLERRRQHVLPGVLLHVVESTRPVDGPVHARSDVERTIDEMHEPAILVIDHVDDGPSAEPPEIVRLPAGGRIERRGRQCHREAITRGRTGRDVGVELRLAGVGVVEAVGHGVRRGR